MGCSSFGVVQGRPREGPTSVRETRQANDKERRTTPMQGKRRVANIARIEKNRQVRLRRRLAQTAPQNPWDNLDENRLVEAWGDDMNTATDKCRIVYNNCRGISPADNFSKCHEIGDSAKELNVSILGLAETCLDWSNVESTNKCKTILRNHWGNTRINQSSSDTTFETVYQPGGTMTAVMGKWAGRASIEGVDAGMGRWSEVRIVGKDNRAAWAITAYRVCGSQTMESTGGKTAFKQQHRILYKAGVENPNPRKQMLHDLAIRIEGIKNAGEEVILMMDSNESLNDSRNELTKWVRRLELTDIIAQKHGTEGEPETYNRGSERIDHIFLTAALSEFVTAAGVLGYNELIQSDHRPLYVDMDLAAFLGGDPSQLENGVWRGITSSDPRAVRLYREQLLKCLEEEKLVEQLDKLVEEIEANSGNLDNKLNQGSPGSVPAAHAARDASRMSDAPLAFLLAPWSSQTPSTGTTSVAQCTYWPRQFNFNL
jgi:hypothetical protein